MNATSRITPVQLSRELIDSRTVQAQYKAGYGLYTVKSKFTDNKSLSDVLFEIILKSTENNICSGRHDF